MMIRFPGPGNMTLHGRNARAFEATIKPLACYLFAGVVERGDIGDPSKIPQRSVAMLKLNMVCAETSRIKFQNQV
jgi:hypothetical protein